MHLRKWLLVFLILFVLFEGCLDAQSDKPAPQSNDPEKMTLKGLQFHIDFETALSAAKEQNKPLFVYIRSETCGWCKKFEGETFTNKSVINKLNENFVLVTLDVFKQKKETRDFRIYGTPTEIFLNSSGAEIKRIPGYTDTQSFLNTINEIV